MELSTPFVQLSHVTPLLRQYKSLMKIITRDSSLKSQYRDELTKVLRDMERWLGAAKVASSTQNVIGWESNEQTDSEFENERWALSRLCEAFLERGGIVPVSNK